MKKRGKKHGMLNKGEHVPETHFPVVLIYGRDWSSERGPLNVDYPFHPYFCWIAGLLIQENDDYITIAQDYCPETNKVRDVITLPKNTILFQKLYD